MHYTATISALHHFQWGQKVRCSDGEAGVLAQVVFDAASHRITALGIRPGRLFGMSVSVSFEAVEAVTEGVITLGISCAELAAAKKVVPSGALLDSKSVVETETTSATAARGNLRSIAVHPESGELVSLVAHHFRPGHDTLLHAEYVTQIATGRVKVALPEATLLMLPHYRSDRELQQEVQQSVYDLTSLHVDFRG